VILNCAFRQIAPHIGEGGAARVHQVTLPTPILQSLAARGAFGVWNADGVEAELPARFPEHHESTRRSSDVENDPVFQDESLAQIGGVLDQVARLAVHEEQTARAELIERRVGNTTAQNDDVVLHLARINSRADG
jgi:hypothetical protein